MADDDRRLVYSTDGTLPLPASSKTKRATPAKTALPPEDGIVRVGCEKRRGGTVTLVYGLRADELDTVAASLKRFCGTGGTAKDGLVVLQGDKRDAVLKVFADAKRATKRMGG